MAESDKNKTTDFQDPLENYDPITFDDPLERALHEFPVTDIQAQPMCCVPANTSVRETLSMMVGKQIACVLVEDNNRLVGVFSDRDVLDKVALEYADVIDGPVSSVMSGDPVFVQPDDSAARVLSVMAVSGYRHVPVIDADHQPIGIVSPQRMAAFLTTHRA